MRKVKIVFFVDTLLEHFDGVSNTMHQIIKQIPKDQIDAIFVTPMPPVNEIGFPVYECPYFEMSINKGYRLARPGKMHDLVRILDDFKPDLVHWSSPSLLGNYAVKYAKRHHLPCTTIYHTHFPTYAQYYLRFIPNISKLTDRFGKFLLKIYFKVSLIFAPTQTMFSYLVQLGIEREKIKIWGRGIDLKHFSPDFKDLNFFQDHQSKLKKYKVLFVSRLVREKETDTLIRLYRLFEENNAELTMILTGEGHDKERMEKLMPNAIFTGMKTGVELSKIYASSDIFIFPSVTETFGNVVLEAMASGIPVIAANAGGPSDIIQNGKTGVLVTPKKEIEFYEAILSLIKNEDYRDAMVKNALDYAESQDWQSLGKAFFNNLIELIQSQNQLKNSAN